MARLRGHRPPARTAVSTVALLLLLVAAGCAAAGSPPTASPTDGSGTAGPSASTSTAPAPSRNNAAPHDSTFRLLWPFQDEAAAAAWQSAYREGGHQPWHLDPAATASGFAEALQLEGVDRTTSEQVTKDQAWIGIGYARPDGSTATAAVVHLVRIGSDADAPWEVVGTRDDTLTLDTPPYGAAVSSPVTVGGEITGVDESLRVQIRAAGSAAILGESCCRPAGGERQRWSVTIGFTGHGEMLAVVSTGGHIAPVERFAVTGFSTR